MKIPKIIFREMTLQENIDTIKWAYYENNGSLSVHDFTVGYFPELATFDENTPQEIVYKKIEEVVFKRNNINELSDMIPLDRVGAIKSFKKAGFINTYKEEKNLKLGKEEVFKQLLITKEMYYSNKESGIYRNIFR